VQRTTFHFVSFRKIAHENRAIIDVVRLLHEAMDLPRQAPREVGDEER